MKNDYISLRIIHGAMLLAAFIYVVIAEVIGGGAKPGIDPVVVWAVTMLALSESAIAMFIRKKMVLDVAPALALDPENRAMQNRWRTGTIITAAFGESIVLFGLVLRFLGVHRSQTVFLYLLGIVVLIIATPKKPANTFGVPPQP